MMIAVKYEGKNKIGDFEWMIQQPAYDTAIFIYCDTDDAPVSLDIFGLRAYKSRAFPIPVCSKESGCFTCLNIYNKLIINAAFNHLTNFIKDNNITTVFYSFAYENNPEIRVTHEHPFVGADVVSYIMAKITSLFPQQRVRFLTPHRPEIQNSKSTTIG